MIPPPRTTTTANTRKFQVPGWKWHQNLNVKHFIMFFRVPPSHQVQPDSNLESYGESRKQAHQVSMHDLMSMTMLDGQQQLLDCNAQNKALV
jgi:hypothetical protein